MTAPARCRAATSTAPAPTMPLVWYEGAAPRQRRRYLLADHQGSIVAVADDAGAALAINTYDEYGIPGAANHGPVPIYRPGLAPRARHVPLQGPHLLADAGAVPADRSDRV